MPRVRLLAILTLCALGLWASRTWGATYQVSPDGLGDFPSIRAAVDAASDGDVIELGDGVFAGDGNRDVDLRGKALTVRSRSGDPGACVIDCGGSEPSPHRGFFVHSGEGADTVLEGVTIRNGYALSGGGILCIISAPTIRNVFFSANQATVGGGLYIFRSSLSVSDCTFRGNVAHVQQGGAVFSKLESTPSFSACKFIDNTAALAGGAVYCREQVHLQVTGCLFVGNHAPDGGALASVAHSDAVVNGCGFDSNEAAHGGGIYCEDFAVPTLTQCELTRNAASHGGAIFCDVASAVMRDCLLTDNRAYTSGGGVYCEDTSNVALTACTLARNTAGWDGGGLFCFDASPLLTGCTLTANSASAALAGGISARGEAHVTLNNTILSFAAQGRAVFCDETSAADLQACDLFGNAGGDWTEEIADQAGVLGNLTADPLFCDAAHDVFTVEIASPCVARIDLTGGPIGAWGVGCGERAESVVSTPAAAALALQVSGLGAAPTGLRIRYEIPPRCAGAWVVLAIHDASGRRIRTLTAAPQDAGLHSASWDGRDQAGAPVASGCFFCRLSAGAETVSARIVRVR